MESFSTSKLLKMESFDTSKLLKMESFGTFELIKMVSLQKEVHVIQRHVFHPALV